MVPKPASPRAASGAPRQLASTLTSLAGERRAEGGPPTGRSPPGRAWPRSCVLPQDALSSCAGVSAADGAEPRPASTASSGGTGTLAPPAIHSACGATTEGGGERKEGKRQG